jgi:hypothetical protein
LGPKGPPNHRPNNPDSGRAFARGLMMANPKIAWNLYLALAGIGTKNYALRRVEDRM